MVQIISEGFREKLFRGEENLLSPIANTGSLGFTYFELVSETASVGGTGDINSSDRLRGDISGLLTETTNQILTFTDLYNQSDDSLISDTDLDLISTSDNTAFSLGKGGQGTYLEYPSSFDYSGADARGVIWFRDISETGAISANDEFISYFDFSTTFVTSVTNSTKILIPLKLIILK